MFWSSSWLTTQQPLCYLVVKKCENETNEKICGQPHFYEERKGKKLDF